MSECWCDKHEMEIINECPKCLHEEMKQLEASLAEAKLDSKRLDKLERIRLLSVFATLEAIRLTQKIDYVGFENADGKTWREAIDKLEEPHE